MPSERDKPVILEDAKLIFMNFAGREQKYNREGDRNFGVLLNPEDAEQLAKDGWNVKTTSEREGDDGEKLGGDPYLPVAVSYTFKPPLVALIGGLSGKRTLLGKDEIELIDYADIEMVDLSVRPYDWEVSGNTGRKAYLKAIYVTIYEDELDLKYAIKKNTDDDDE